MPDERQVERAVEAFRLLSDPTRVRILWALLQGESSVACLADLAGVTPTAVSQHLAKLRLAGAVRPRRDGQRVWYELADPEVRDLVEHLLAASREDAGPGVPGHHLSDADLAALHRDRADT